MSQSVFVGVDGCPAGWFSVELDINGSLVRCGVYGTFDQLLTCNAEAELVLVDMPIGLSAAREGRACDKEARKKLGHRASSVFTTPTRLTARVAMYTDNYRASSCVEQEFARRASAGSRSTLRTRSRSWTSF